MDFAKELAQLFKSNENIPQNNIIIGTVTKVLPLQISIFDGHGLLDSDDVFVCSRLDNVVNLKSLTAVKASWVSDIPQNAKDVSLTDVKITIRDTQFLMGEKLLIATNTEYTEFYVIDRLEELK